MPLRILTIWSLLIMTIQAQPHFNGQQFYNPFPGFESRDFGDLFRWLVIDRVTGKRPTLPDSYHFELADNDGRYLRTNRSDVTVTWIGHSTLLIQNDGLNILTDPIWSQRASPLSFAGPKRMVPPGIPLDSLPKIDVVLISHDHYDHLDKQTIRRLGNRPLYLVPLGVGALLKSWGIDHYVEMDWWDEFRFNGVLFACTPAQHFSGRTLFDRNRRLWCSWVISGKEARIYFGGDSGYFPDYAKIGRQYGPFDLAALPIGAYRPRWFMSPVHMSPGEAVRAFVDLQARIFIPIHWGTFPLSDEPLTEPPQLLLKKAKQKGLDANRFWILKHGETRTVPQALLVEGRALKHAQSKGGNGQID